MSEGLPGCDSQRLPANPYPAVQYPLAVRATALKHDWKDYKAVTSGQPFCLIRPRTKRRTDGDDAPSKVRDDKYPQISKAGGAPETLNTLFQLSADIRR